MFSEGMPIAISYLVPWALLNGHFVCVYLMKKNKRKGVFKTAPSVSLLLWNSTAAPHHFLWARLNPSLPPQEMFDIILDENQLEDACEHMADYLEAYWKSTHPTSCNPPNPLLTSLPAATLPPGPALVSGVQVRKQRPHRATPAASGRETHSNGAILKLVVQDWFSDIWVNGR